jgi:hypothetical protein
MASIAQFIPGGFNAANVEPQAARDNAPLPAGVYSVELTNADVKPLKSGNGVGLEIECTVIDPAPFARRKIWQTLNIQHSNPQAEQIGQSQLSALCRAVGIAQLDDSDQLFQKILRVRTKIRAAQGNYAAKAEISGFEPAGAALPATPQQPAAPARQATPAAAPPWARKSA